MSKDVAKRVMNWDGIEKDDKGKLLYFVAQFRKSADSMMSNYLEAAAMVAQANAILSKPGCKGKFIEFVEIEMGISKQTAYNMVAVNRKFGGSNSTSVGLFTPSAMIELSSSKLPDDVIEKAKELASGGKVTGSIAKKAKQTLEIPMDHATVTETEVEDDEPITAPGDDQTQYEDVDPPEPKTTTKATPRKPSPIDLVPQIQSAASRLDGMVKELKELAGQMGGEWLGFDMQQISDEAHALKYRIRNTIFWNVCPECDGKKCSHCKQLGWLSKSRKTFLTANGKAKLGE